MGRTSYPQLSSADHEHDSISMSSPRAHGQQKDSYTLHHQYIKNALIPSLFCTNANTHSSSTSLTIQHHHCHPPILSRSTISPLSQCIPLPPSPFLHPSSPSPPPPQSAAPRPAPPPASPTSAPRARPGFAATAPLPPRRALILAAESVSIQSPDGLLDRGEAPAETSGWGI